MYNVILVLLRIGTLHYASKITALHGLDMSGKTAITPRKCRIFSFRIGHVSTKCRKPCQPRIRWLRIDERIRLRRKRHMLLAYRFINFRCHYSALLFPFGAMGSSCPTDDQRRARRSRPTITAVRHGQPIRAYIITYAATSTRYAGSVRRCG